MIKVVLADGSKKEYPKGSTVAEIAESISVSLKKKAVGAKINDEWFVDMSHQIEEDVHLAIITIDSEEGVSIMRHSSAHVMAQAIKRLYPNVQLAIESSGRGWFLL